MSSNPKIASATSYRPVRRIVTGHDENGRSVFLADGDAPNVKLHDHGSMVAQVLWTTDSMPVSCAGDEDPAPSGTVFRAGPKPHGTILRVVDFPPDSAYDNVAASGVTAEIDPDAHGDDSARHFFFHKTQTLDYAIVLEGEIWAMMDDGETLMQAGDVLIQRATHHSWSNRSDVYCRMAFVLIDAGAEVA